MMQLHKTTIFLLGVALLSSPLLANSGSDKVTAVRMYNRIVGMPPTAEIISKMSALIAKGKRAEAALLATDSFGFYNIKLRHMFSAWSNTGGSSDVNLNDMVATMIGMVRDDIPFNLVLSGNFIYVGKTAGLPPYSLADNNHYVQLQRLDLRSALEKKKQSEVTNLPEAAHAGVLSTRAFAQAFFSAGTNRRATAFTLEYFLCRNMDSLHDTSIPDAKVRHDVSRLPGDDRELYDNRCKGCHAAMDAVSGWSSYYDFENGAAIYTPGSVAEKILDADATQYPDGHRPNDDSFENLWISSDKDSGVGWKDIAQGKGAKDYGYMLAASDSFASCMATQVWQQVCLVTPKQKKEIAARDELGREFIKQNYNLKQLFAATAARCL